MITHKFADELVEIANALKPTEPELAALNVYRQQTGQTRSVPALVIRTETVRQYRTSAVVRLTLTVESNAGDDAEPDPNNHLSRVALVERLFLTEKADRIAELAARGNLTVDDWGQVPGRLDADHDDTGDKLRSALVLLAIVRTA
jgi:hypothetical protein